MIITNHKNISEHELEQVVLRYLTFPKFISLITYNAIWFPKLNILQDQYEGMMPVAVKKEIKKDYEKHKEYFPDPEHKKQIDSWADTNESDGRELLVASCWFIGPDESIRMWNEYVGSNEGVAIKTNIKKLATHIYVIPDDHMTMIGKVRYIDFQKTSIDKYEAHQAIERSFLKSNRFEHESEIRIITMNLKTVNCVSMEGKRYEFDECQGKGMNNFENPGLFVGVNIRELIDEIIIAPGAPKWFENLVRRIVELININAKVNRSSLNG